MEWLELVNYMVRNGFLDTEFFIYAIPQWEEIVRGGNVFANNFNMGAADSHNRFFYENNIEGPWFTMPQQPLTWRGEMRFQPIDGGIGWASTFISKNNRNPERSIQFMQFLKSPFGDALTQWGIYGEHYTLSEEGFIIRPTGWEERTVQETGIGPWYFQTSGLGEGVAVTSGLIGPQPHLVQGVHALMQIKPFVYRDPSRAFWNPIPDTTEFDIRNRLIELWNASRIEMYNADSVEELHRLYDQFIVNAEAVGASTLREFHRRAYAEARERYAGVN
jgi:putative aldouronate transport system substrate-binding protein